MSENALLVLVTILATGAVSLAVQWFASLLTNKRDMEKEKRQRSIDYNCKMVEPAQSVLAKAATRAKKRNLVEILLEQKEINDPDLKQKVKESVNETKVKEILEIFEEDLPVVASTLDTELRDKLTTLLAAQIKPISLDPIEFDKALRQAHDRIRQLVTEVN